jgi:hypothetical protein
MQRDRGGQQGRGRRWGSGRAVDGLVEHHPTDLLPGGVRAARDVQRRQRAGGPTDCRVEHFVGFGQTEGGMPGRAPVGAPLPVGRNEGDVGGRQHHHRAGIQGRHGELPTQRQATHIARIGQQQLGGPTLTQQRKKRRGPGARPARAGKAGGVGDLVVCRAYTGAVAGVVDRGKNVVGGGAALPRGAPEGERGGRAQRAGGRHERNRTSRPPTRRSRPPGCGRRQVDVTRR